MTGAERVAAERRRQVEGEGRTPEHDAAEMALAAVGYAAAAHAIANGVDHDYLADDPHQWWPWDQSSWKPSADPIRNLEKAGALIAAEIDRLQAAARLPTCSYCGNPEHGWCDR